MLRKNSPSYILEAVAISKIFYFIRKSLMIHHGCLFYPDGPLCTPRPRCLCRCSARPACAGGSMRPASHLPAHRCSLLPMPSSTSPVAEGMQGRPAPAVPHQVGRDRRRRFVFKCFRYFQTCCKPMFQVFQLFQMYVSSV
jgi:hypothetical protein